MTTSFVLALPAQELEQLRTAAATSPQFAYLLAKLPGFQAALDHPIPNLLLELAHEARDAAYRVQDNTQYPEDWVDLINNCETIRDATKACCLAQQKAVADHTPPASTGCPACGGHRRVFSQSAGDAHWLSIPHLEFQADYTYTPANMGIPKDGGDGPSLSVCLDCGRVQNGVYPVSDEHLVDRIAQYRRMCGDATID